MRIQIRLLIALILMNNWAMRVVATEPKTPMFTLQISMPKTTIKSGAPATVTATATNRSDREMFVAVGLPRRGININVFDSKNGLVRETPYGLKAHGKDVRPFAGTVFSETIKPGQSFGMKTDLNKEYDLAKPGKYIVQAQRWDDYSLQMVKSNTIMITVTQ